MSASTFVGGNVVGGRVLRLLPNLPAGCKAKDSLPRASKVSLRRLTQTAAALMLSAGMCLSAASLKPSVKKVAVKAAQKAVPAKRASVRVVNRVAAKTPARRLPVAASLRAPQARLTEAKFVRTPRAHAIATGPWKVPTFANSSEGDRVDGDDLMIRRAAVEGLGSLNGSVVVAQAETGRILTIVNQKLAYRDGFEPCSTVKIPVALAALSESLVERQTLVRLNRRTSIDMTNALARSSNEYFASLGERLGFDRVSFYARQFGLGEKASLNIEEEKAGLLPSSTPDAGMGMMTSFGDGISQTPLELTAIVTAVANGGKLLYLQYPRTQEELDNFTPRLKRRLDIDGIIPEIMPGLKGAVDFGTARRIAAGSSELIYGKTGTCTDERSPTHLGWFGSFMETPRGRLVVTVLLTGGRPVSGPVAAGVAGQIYRNIENSGYFLAREERPRQSQQPEASLIPGFPNPGPSEMPRLTSR